LRIQRRTIYVVLLAAVAILVAWYLFVALGHGSGNSGTTQTVTTT